MTPLEMVMLSITWVTLTPLSDGKEHAGTALQHSQAGGYELLALLFYLQRIFPFFFVSLWVWVSPMSTNIRVLCYFKDCCRDTLKTDVLCSSSGRAEKQLTLTGATQSVHLDALAIVSLPALHNSAWGSQHIGVSNCTAGRTMNKECHVCT